MVAGWDSNQGVSHCHSGIRKVVIMRIADHSCVREAKSRQGRTAARIDLGQCFLPLLVRFGDDVVAPLSECRGRGDDVSMVTSTMLGQGSTSVHVVGGAWGFITIRKYVTSLHFSQRSAKRSAKLEKSDFTRP